MKLLKFTLTTITALATGRIQALATTYNQEDTAVGLAFAKAGLGIRPGIAGMPYERNDNWIGPIIGHATAQPSFFAVGAARLAGIQRTIGLPQGRGGCTLTLIME